jgi:GNAT superfamily N-acetyltransferase
MEHIVRRVLPYEYPKYRAHLKALDVESRILRFGFFAKDETIDALCDGIEKHPTEHVLFCIENTKLEFVGIGHIALEPEMELAFSVLNEYRRQGFANALMKRCVQYCRTHNILTGKMVCLSTNSAIKGLCRKHGISMENDHGETLGDITLPNPDITTYINEQLSSQAAILDFTIKRNPINLAAHIIKQ